MSKLDDFLAQVEAECEKATKGMTVYPLRPDAWSTMQVVDWAQAMLSIAPALVKMLREVLPDALAHKDGEHCRRAINPGYTCSCGAENLRATLEALVPEAKP